MKRAAASPPTTAIAGARSRISRLPGGLAAQVQLVAHVQALGGEPEDVDRPALLEHARQARAEVVAEEAQPLDRLVVADAEPQRPPGTLVERRERAPPDVLHDPDRHRRRADARHRPDVAVLVARRERDLAARQQGLRLRSRVRPALEQHRGHERAPLRVAHALPRRSAAPSAAARPREARRSPWPPAQPSPPAARRPRPSPRPTRWPPRPRGRADPTAGSARRARPGPRPPAGASRPRPPARPARAERRRTSPARGSPPRRGAGRRLEGSCAPPRCLNDRDGRSGRAGGARHDGTGSARQARPRPRRRAWTPGSTATTPRSSPTATGTSSPAARRSRRRSCSPTRTARARPRSSPTSRTSGRWGRGRWASSTCWSRRARTTPKRSWTASRWAAERLGVPVLGGHLTLGHAPALSASATGFTRAPAAEPPRPDPATSCWPRSRPTAGT